MLKKSQKIYYWIILLFILTYLNSFRLNAMVTGSLSNGDIFLISLWFILAILPLINEVSVNGISIKKDIEDAKNEIKSYITEIHNNNNFQPIINVNALPVPQKEYEKKVEEEVKEDIRNENKIKEKSIESKEDINSHIGIEKRIATAMKVEKEISKIFLEKYKNNYKEQVRFENTRSKKTLIADGIIFGGDKLELVEIKLITGKSFDNIYFILSRHIKKIFDLGGMQDIYIRFVLVSESMNTSSAKLIKEQVDRLNFNKSLVKNLPNIKIDFYKLDDNKLLEIKI